MRRGFSSRENTDYKWQRASKGHVVVGALEIPSDPELDVRGEYEEKPVEGKEAEFESALRAWSDYNMRKQFVRSCENDVPVVMSCCGILVDSDAMILETARVLNAGWCKLMNEQLTEMQEKILVDCFVWSWENPAGKSKSTFLLVRFLSTRDDQQHETE